MAKEESQNLKELQELVEKLQKKTEELKEKLSATTQQPAIPVTKEKCWAGIEMKDCPHQSNGNLVQVNANFCRDCHQTRFIKGHLFNAIGIIFKDEIDEATKEGIEEEVKDNLEAAKDEVKNEYEDRLKDIRLDLEMILDDLDKIGEEQE